MEREGKDSDTQFIAIDLSNVSEELDEQDKDEIFSHFKEKYSVDVIEATFVELEEKGLYFPRTGLLDGVLLKIEKVDFKWNDRIYIEGSLKDAPLGSFGLGITIHYEDEEWKVKETKLTWIS